MPSASCKLAVAHQPFSFWIQKRQRVRRKSHRIRPPFPSWLEDHAGFPARRDQPGSVEPYRNMVRMGFWFVSLPDASPPPALAGVRRGSSGVAGRRSTPAFGRRYPGRAAGHVLDRRVMKRSDRSPSITCPRHIRRLSTQSSRTRSGRSGERSRPPGVPTHGQAVMNMLQGLWKDLELGPLPYQVSPWLPLLPWLLEESGSRS